MVNNILQSGAPLLGLPKSVYFNSRRRASGVQYPYRGILVYNICLISISNSVSDGATNKSVLNIERS